MALAPGSNAGVNWIQCDDCNGWTDYALSGLPQPYNARDVKKRNYSCRLCGIQGRMEDLIGKNVALQTKLDEIMEENREIRTRLSSLEAGSVAEKNYLAI